MIGSHCRFSRVNSWEMFGTTLAKHDELTHSYPRSPHGEAKVYSSWMTPYGTRRSRCCSNAATAASTARSQDLRSVS